MANGKREGGDVTANGGEYRTTVDFRVVLLQQMVWSIANGVKY